MATFTWRPVYDIEQRTRQHELNALASEKRMQESNARIARFEQELFSSLNPAPANGDTSPT
jgi:hypothetical protein